MRIAIIVAAGFTLAACSSAPATSWMQVADTAVEGAVIALIIWILTRN